MDNFKIIYKILLVLEKSMDLESIDTERISSNELLKRGLNTLAKIQ